MAFYTPQLRLTKFLLLPPPPGGIFCGTPSELISYTLKNICAKFGAFTRLVTIFAIFRPKRPDYKSSRGGAFDHNSYGVVIWSLASISFKSRADSTWHGKSRRRQAFMHSKRKIHDSWRTGWKAKACLSFVLYLKVFKNHLYYFWHVRVLSIVNHVYIHSFRSILRWFPHNLRAIMAKIKLPEKPGGMLLFWIQLIRTYRDLSSQADPARENWTWSCPYFT